MASAARTIIHKRKGNLPGEVIVEFNSRAGFEHSWNGGLISIRPDNDGKVTVEIYRADDGVVVVCDPERLSECSKPQAPDTRDFSPPDI